MLEGVNPVVTPPNVGIGGEPLAGHPAKGMHAQVLRTRAYGAAPGGLGGPPGA